MAATKKRRAASAAKSASAAPSRPTRPTGSTKPIRSITPVTLVTGYLGAGKTTLVNELIGAFGAKERVAVIVNEFGEIGIDGELIAEQAGREKVFELANGCLCCVVTGEFRATLESVVTKGFTRVIIETSGAADPTSVQRTLWGAAELSSLCRLDAVVCVADAENFAATVKADPIALVQASIADAILVTKSGRAGPARASAARELIASLNPSALVIEHDFGAEKPRALDARALLALDAYRKPISAFYRAADAAVAHGGLSSVSVSWDGPIAKAEMQRFFRELVAEGKTLRLKAILHVADESRPWLIQGVQSWIEKSLAPKSYDGPNKLVVLGRGFDEARLRSAIERLKTAKIG